MIVTPFPLPIKELFLTLLPKLELHGRIFFGHVKCTHKRQDAIAEMVALAWKYFVRLMERGKDPSNFPTTFVTFAARAVYTGRRLCGQEKTKDVLSSLGQQRHGFAVQPLPAFSSLNGNMLEEALHDNTQTPVADQVAFRFDFPAWLEMLMDRNRKLAIELMMGHSTKAMARRFGLTPARVSQLRRQFHQEWQAFIGEAEVGNPSTIVPCRP